MKMGDIPLLYKLVCQAYSGTWIPGYQQAFDKTMSEGERSCLIILRMACEVNKIPYRNKYIPNPFIWQVTYK